jgi:hypothetical protein
MHCHEIAALCIKSKYLQQLQYLRQPILYCPKNVEKYHEWSLELLIEVMTKNEFFLYVAPCRLVNFYMPTSDFMKLFTILRPGVA